MCVSRDGDITTQSLLVCHVTATAQLSCCPVCHVTATAQLSRCPVCHVTVTAQLSHCPCVDVQSSVTSLHTVNCYVIYILATYPVHRNLPHSLLYQKSRSSWLCNIHSIYISSPALASSFYRMQISLLFYVTTCNLVGPDVSEESVFFLFTAQV